jgi:16S rRNA (uracil1498-N3)-methyltransferase
MLDMATQLGIASFTPLSCRRSVAQASGKSHERWERICRSACKQALVRYRPELRATARPEDFVRATGAGGAVVFLADALGQAALRLDPGAHDLALVVGPEGGFTAEERAAMIAAGARPWRLAPGVLRVEAAVVTGLAVLQHFRGTA